MTHDDERWVLREQAQGRKRQVWTRALIAALKIYVVLGLVFAALSAGYFLLLLYDIKLTPEQERALVFFVAGVLVSTLSALGVGYLRRYLDDYDERTFHRVAARYSELPLEPTAPMIEEVIERPRSLPSHLAASFAIQWSNFEAICREALRPVFDSRNMPIGRVLDLLLHEGILDDREALLARECLAVRNDIVHGLVARTPSEIQALSVILNELASEVSLSIAKHGRSES